MKDTPHYHQLLSLINVTDDVTDPLTSLINSLYKENVETLIHFLISQFYVIYHIIDYIEHLSINYEI